MSLYTVTASPAAIPSSACAASTVLRTGLASAALSCAALVWCPQPPQLQLLPASPSSWRPPQLGRGHTARVTVSCSPSLVAQLPAHASQPQSNLTHNTRNSKQNI